MELNGLGPKSLKDASVQTAKKTEVPVAADTNVKTPAKTLSSSESVSISQAAKNLFAQEQRIGQSEPHNAKVGQLKKLVQTGEYQQTIDDEELAKNILSYENDLYPKK